MDDLQRLHIDLILAKAVLAARREVGIEAAEADAIAAREDVLDISRRWVVLASILAKHGQRFVEDVSASVRAVSTTADALELYDGAVAEFIAHLDEIYSGKHGNWSAWHSKPSLVPPHWYQARHEIELGQAIEQFKFGRSSSPEALGEPQSIVEHQRWTDAEMRDAIVACDIGNRDDAWRERFGPRQAEHGWTNSSFRQFWSEARGTRGMMGRPEKRA